MSILCTAINMTLYPKLAFDAEMLGGVEARHLDRGDRLEALGDGMADHAVHVAIVDQRTGMAVVGAQDEIARIEALLSVMLQDENVRLPGYRRHDLAHRAEQQGLEVSELTMQKLGKLASKS